MRLTLTDMTTPTEILIMIMGEGDRCLVQRKFPVNLPMGKVGAEIEEMIKQAKYQNNE